MHAPDVSVLDGQTTLFWFRRDLRLEDNCGLYHALKQNHEVVGIFIFDSNILNSLEDPDDARVTFIYDSLLALNQKLLELGASLLVFHGDPVSILSNLKVKAVYTNHDYEPYARKRDQFMAQALNEKGIVFKTFKDQVVFECDEVLKDDGSPYTVFTPYSKKWKSQLTDALTRAYPTEKYQSSFKMIPRQRMPSLETIGFRRSTIKFPARVIKKGIIKTYDQTRNFPGVEGTSRLSVHLRFGTISIRNLIQVALKTNETWLNELIWREFYMMILYHFPHVVDKAFKPAYDRIEWRNNPDEFAAWCEGRTGYPIVDAGMRELNATGYMHNRVRMIVASFLTKHLLIDWRWGEAYFARKLLDFDLAANNGGWQWSAGSGCDAAPYFRVFNPALQTDKFDPDYRYIKKWVPEFATPDYPSPLVDHNFARERVLRVYKTALESDPKVIR